MMILRNPRTENIQKVVSRKKNNLRIFQDPKSSINQFWA